jgi:putative CocE/NonD family hydrolase
MDRSPYGYDGIEALSNLYLVKGIASCGQDMRGTKKSEGNFTIWHSDAVDGETTINWITSQPWSSGSVLSFGASADGLASYTLLDTHPDALDAQFIIWSSSQGYPIIYPGGAYRESLSDNWMRDTVYPNSEADRCISEIYDNEQPNPWWEPLNMTVDNDDYKVVKWPSLHWAGWYDIFLTGQLIAYDGYKNHAADGNDDDTKIFIDPLGHCQEGASSFPKHTIQGRSALPILQSYELYMSTVTGKPFGNATDHYLPYRESIKDVTFYVMGSTDDDASGNYWTTMDTFPAFTPTKFSLNSDFTLTTSPSSSSSPISFQHDPADPVPSLGGSNLFIPCGPYDQSPNLDRSDVLTFSSDPLDSPMAITGPLKATLKVSSDAIDTDFYVKLVDVYPTGEHKLIQEGAVRMRNTIFKDIDDGGEYEVDLNLWNTSYVFSEGHRTGVIVTSSNYPRFSNNQNNGRVMSDPDQYSDPIVATNSILPGSFVELPVVELMDLPRCRVIEDINEKYVEYGEMAVEFAEKRQQQANLFGA